MGLIGPIECQSMDEMRAVMDTNFFGLVRLLKEILPDMKRRKKGHIVVISSVMGIQGEWEASRSRWRGQCYAAGLVTKITRQMYFMVPFRQESSSTMSTQHPSLPLRASVRA